MRKLSSLLMVVSAIIIVIGGGAYYWYYSTYYPSTNNAYVHANITHIAPNISGPVSEVCVLNNAYVKKGALLYRIDKRRFKIALANAIGNLELAKQALAQEKLAINIAKKNITKAKAHLVLQTKETERTLTLLKTGRVSKQAGDEARAALTAAKASVDAANDKLQQALAAYGIDGDENGRLKASRAAVANAKLNLSYTDIYAKADGQVVQFKLRVGDVVQNGVSNFALIESSQFWVDANFKETDLKRIKVNQEATLRLDMYPDRIFKGYVQSISGGSGSVFALLPPENASGNWVKITQRIPVKILIKPEHDMPALRVGSSVKVVIDTND